MTRFIELGPTPYGESRTQTGCSDNWQHWQKLECEAFRDQIKRQLPPPPGASLTIRANPRDFGTYREVAVRYDLEDAAQFAYAYFLDASTPEFWDAEAKAYLKQNGYPLLKG